ncbi:MAG: Gfo/Idh/MocA family oxidoreductase [Deltaproteobacteria bacterium]|nr:Gfo/Idh/MocA family oxidoreductase [Deltaproteobacteria bacterium]
MIQIVLVGLGKMGGNHFRILSAMSGCRIAAVVDSDPQLAKEFGDRGKCPAFASLDAALQEVRPEAIVIAASTSTHFELASLALKNKIPVLVEKPIAATVKEALHLCRLACETQTPFMVGHVERFNPAVVTAHHLIRTGELGEILTISSKRVGGNPSDQKRAGDVLVDLAVHDLDLFKTLLGKVPQLISCVGYGDQEIHCATLLLKVGKTLVDAHVNWLTPVKVREIQIIGSKGYCFLNLITQQATLVRQNPLLTQAEIPKEFFFDSYLKSFAQPDKLQIGIQQKEPLQQELTAFIAAITGHLTMPVPPEDGLDALRIADQARKTILNTEHCSATSL